MKSSYTESLGLTLEYEGKAKAGYSVVTLRAGESLIDLFEASPTNPAPPADPSEAPFVYHWIKHLRCDRYAQARIATGLI
jgi:hypothetical protein